MQAGRIVAGVGLVASTMLPAGRAVAPAHAEVPVVPQERLLVRLDSGPAAVEGDGTGLRPIPVAGATSATGRFLATHEPITDRSVTLSFGDGACPRRIDFPDVFGVRIGAFSPDEATLSVTTFQLASREPVDQKVELVDVATGTRSFLVNGSSAAWSPDGTSLVYDSSTNGAVHGAIRTIRRDGTGGRDLGVVGTVPQWSPDGSRVAYLRSGEVLVVDLATGVEDRVWVGPAATIRWTGDGTGLYFDVTSITNPAPNGIARLGLDGAASTGIPGPRYLVDVVRRPGARDPGRYRSVTAQGTVRTFGPGCGANGSATAASGTGIVSGAASADALGAWTVTPAGSVRATGQAGMFGDTSKVALWRPVVGMAGTPSTRGYWLVASDGGIFAYGDARFLGSTGGTRLNRPVVGMAPTPSGNGYWLVASDGGVFAYGDARFLGSTGGITLNRPVVGMAPTPSGNGYWLVASDGGIFAYGDAAFSGSTGGIALQRPIVGLAPTPSGTGYRLAGDDGGIFAFGDAPFAGSAVGAGPAGTVAVLG